MYRFCWITELLKRTVPVMWRNSEEACVLGPVWHMVWKKGLSLYSSLGQDFLEVPWSPLLFSGLLKVCPVGLGRQYLTTAFSWISVFKNYSCISLCFFFMDIAFVLTHLRDSLVMWSHWQNWHSYADLTSFKCLYDSFLKLSELIP